MTEITVMLQPFSDTRIGRDGFNKCVNEVLGNNQMITLHASLTILISSGTLKSQIDIDEAVKKVFIS